MSDVGWPRLTRNAEGRPMWDQGPLGMSVVLASIPLPERWPEHWPEPPLSDHTASLLLHAWRTTAFEERSPNDTLGCSVVSAAQAEAALAFFDRPRRIVPRDVMELYRAACGDTLSVDGAPENQVGSSDEDRGHVGVAAGEDDPGTGGSADGDALEVIERGRGLWLRRCRRRVADGVAAAGRVFVRGRRER